MKAATDRSRACIHRSLFDGDRHFQTAVINKSYAVFRTAIAHPATGRKTSIRGQTYPSGVMVDRPAREGAHFLRFLETFRRLVS